MRIAVIERHHENIRKAVVVPQGQDLELDDKAERRWLWGALGTEWHLVEFMDLELCPTSPPGNISPIERKLLGIDQS